MHRAAQRTAEIALFSVIASGAIKRSARSVEATNERGKSSPIYNCNENNLNDGTAKVARRDHAHCSLTLMNFGVQRTETQT